MPSSPDDESPPNSAAVDVTREVYEIVGTWNSCWGLEVVLELLHFTRNMLQGVEVIFSLNYQRVPFCSCFDDLEWLN